MTPMLYTLSAHKSIQILDRNDEQLFVYLRNGLKETWDHPNPTDPNCTSNNLERLVHRSLNLLAEKYLPDPKKTDKRYNGSSRPAWIESWTPSFEGEKPPVYGTYYLSIWCGQGQKKKDPVLISDLRGTGDKFNHASVFLKRITPLHQTIGLVFEAVNHTDYRKYLRVFHHRLGITALDALHTSRRNCFMGVAVNRNNQSYRTKMSPTFETDGR